MAVRPYFVPFTPELRVEVLCLQETVTYLHLACRLLSLYIWFTVDRVILSLVYCQLFYMQ